MTDALTRAYVDARPRSAAIAERARGLFRPYIVRAAGSRKWDVDGHEYLDYVMGHGELILGHSHPLEVEWAERIRGLMPAAERIEFFASGQEANQMGVRLLKFKHNYHGWADGARRGTGESGLRGGAAGEWRGPGSPGGWR